jgi:hypothetical protein
MPEIRKIQISVRIQISAATGFSAGWLKISANSQRLRNRADDKGCTLAAQMRSKPQSHNVTFAVLLVRPHL